ncbi:MAG TPA: indolepyruvate ferredoxin oxidoreductase family protein [Burkholderiaceae bacterium]|nr:indolepyruvate ferredoxin oxidoreductase family protein [Burkholderiaceae bacterium]
MTEQTITAKGAETPDEHRFRPISLDDKYALHTGQTFMSGVQALVKLPMLQQQRDATRGKHTAGFISGYRGSPLGGYDQALVKATPFLKAKDIVFQPGVNEELAATAIWGTQQLGFAPAGTNKFDGVFGIWYGKGPGVDRCADVFKHANMAGTTEFGGVIAVAGDDHVAKSSTAAHQSDHIFKACGLPVFFPASVQEILDLGIHAFAMSRFSGVWAGMKTIQEIVESSATVDLDPERVKVVIPTDFEIPADGVHIRWPDAALAQEARLFDTKWYAALAYIRANKLNYNAIEGPNDKLGLIASGKAYNDTRQALLDLGLDDATCREIGIRLHKVGVVWPLEAQLTREFATGLQEILVVEEKRQVIEYQLKEELYNWRNDVRPVVLGKFNEMEGGEWSTPNPSAQALLRANADLSPSLIAKAIAARLIKLGLVGGHDSAIRQRIDTHLAILESAERAMTLHAQMGSQTASRQAWFCSGCPHNTSTKVPEGSRAMAGIGCHFMSIWMDRSTIGFTQMGGEGVPWVGQQAFSTEQHVFANLGDGTYFHSGLLAIRQAIAAGVNITYKILYNDAVAMTGGQQVGERPEGHSVQQIAQSVRSEGATQIVVVTDDPDKYKEIALPEGIDVRHRDELDMIQKQYRSIHGVTVIIYDQTCATEKRRRLKRAALKGNTPRVSKRVVINERVCEGCGDCSEQSNCLSIEPLETEFGRKRSINQSTCNTDFSCVKGFCPSFVTVEGGKLKGKSNTSNNPNAKEVDAIVGAIQPDKCYEYDSTIGNKYAAYSSKSSIKTTLPLPTLPSTTQSYGIVVTGVGGTGVITIGQLLGYAAHIEGKGIVTQDAGGLAQKGGATWSHVLIADQQNDIRTTRVGFAGADLIIACDPIVTAQAETLNRMRRGHTRVALNAHSTPTAAFVKNPTWQNPAQVCASVIAEMAGSTSGNESVSAFNADALATSLLGDSIYTNPIMLGYAWQKGWIPLRKDSLMQAIELNAVAVANNKAAFEWGCRAAHNWAEVEALLQPAQVIRFHGRENPDELIAKFSTELSAYQNKAYAKQYEDFVALVHSKELTLNRSNPNNRHASRLQEKQRLTEAVARNLFKLMAYKDEYEVARLHSDGTFKQKIADLFEGDYKLHFHLAPPLFAKKNEKGELQKQTFGAWMLPCFQVLAKMKFLRGTPFDVFGYTKERKDERDLLNAYITKMQSVTSKLDETTLAQAIEWARLPESVKGYGHIKAKAMTAAIERLKS